MSPVLSPAPRRAIAVLLAIVIVASSCGSTAPDSPAPEGPISTEQTVRAVRDSADAFIADQTTTTARAFLAAVADDGDDRWVPWLIDLLRLQVSTLLSGEIGAVLQTMTGVPSTQRIPDLLAYGTWSANQGQVGGDGYREFKVAIYENFDAEFGPFLQAIEDPQELAAIQWGGVKRGGIPELNSQSRALAVDASWMTDDEVVMGVVVNGQAVAYPLAIMQRHELANDVVGGEPIAIVYCTLCKSGLVFRSTVGDRVLHFQTSGLLYNSNKIMVDVETDTLWHHLRGLGIGGELLGTKLDLLSVNHMRWSDWVAENPDTEVIELPEPIFFDEPERPPISYDYTPGEAYRSYYENPNVWFPILDTPPTFGLKTEVVGIDHNDDAVAFEVAAFNAAGVTEQIEVGGTVFTVEPTGAGIRVFDPSGERVVTEQSFWFAWYANHPQTRSWP